MHTKRAYSYIRFSREHQNAGDSFRRQLKASQEYCARLDLQLDESLNLRDLGVSGFKGRNVEKGALGRFLLACEQGRVPKGSALVIEALDRLSRQSPRKTINLLSSILDYGVEVHLTASGKIFRPDAGNEEGLDLIIAVAMAIEAYASSEQKAVRIRAAWAAIRDKARITKNIIRRDVPWWLSVVDGKIVCPEERKQVVEKIFRLTADGYSSGQVARQLNTDQTNTWRKRKVWDSVRVRSLIRSKSPQGFLEATSKTKIAGRNYEPIPNYYPVIIEDGLANAARAVLVRNHKGSRGRQTTTTRPLNLFRGLLRFKGRWMRHASHSNGTRDLKTGKRGWNSYYECFDELHGSEQGKLIFGISAKQLEPVLLSGLAELKSEDLRPSVTNTVHARASKLRGQLTSAESAQQNLLATVEQSGSQLIALRLTELEAQVRRIRAELEQLETMSVPVVHSVAEVKHLLCRLDDKEVRERAAAALRRMIIRVDVATTLSDIPVTDRFRLRYLRGRDRMLQTAQVLPDPVPDTKRRKDLFLLVTFASSAFRLIYRTSVLKGKIVSARIEAGDSLPLSETKESAFASD